MAVGQLAESLAEIVGGLHERMLATPPRKLVGPEKAHHRLRPLEVQELVELGVAQQSGELATALEYGAMT